MPTDLPRDQPALVVSHLEAWAPDLEPLVVFSVASALEEAVMAALEVAETLTVA